MSRITENADCDDCNYPAHGGNDTGSRVHSIMDEDDELLRYIWTDYLHPKEYEWVLIVAYIVVFFVSLIGNSLVCFAVWKNRHMRTVTNYFIVNLSLADVLVTIICLPASLVVDITETWFFGETLCKIVPYLQTISVSVSVLTLSCIAQDRWYAICHPLKFKSTAKRARKSIIAIWVVSCIIMIPQAIVMECSSLLPELTNKTSLFTVCDEHWGADVYPKVYHTGFFIVTYFAPLCLMVLAYIQIFHKLWCQQIPGNTSVIQRNWRTIQCSAPSSGSGESGAVKTSTVSAEIKQIRARRKTARMLMVVLFVFALCYLPISVLNILKRVFGTFKNTNDRETIYAWFTFSHWLIYANSAANPIIYNFLSGKFREEFKSAFSCSCYGQQKDNNTRMRTRANRDSRKSMSTQVNNVDNLSRLSDQIV
ncbi:orexin receptor type 2 [Xiphophorus maculatus]|uniref:Orexin receptor type 2 n=1 Tax=Xiphophorus maculatus TaxID=8083 RepID=M4A6Y2_XIPMA|nr:orexin receptor type 2 [Xiphophorus maculatus]XP_027863577.1 orexin receptor type 2 [Xiphophorus couchianus]XP_032408261.1 orexin receptor type 2 [Xiphophorus hellerii]